jgi:hypothetical protein
MTATMQSHSNGRARKSLSDQIDRLDQILDGLSEGLNEAVATVVHEAVQIAVKEAFHVVTRELLTHPDLLARLAKAGMPASATLPNACSATLGVRIRERLTQLWHGVRAGTRVVNDACRRCVRFLRGRLLAAGQLLRRGIVRCVARGRMLWQLKRRITIALGVGCTAAVIVWMTGPWLAPITTGLGGFFSTLAVQTGVRLRRLSQNLAS